MNLGPFEPFAQENDIHIAPSVQFAEGVTVQIKGKNHVIKIEDGVVLRNIKIIISGQKNNLYISKGVNIRGSIHLRHSQSKVFIDENTTFVGVNLFALEGKEISIKKDCMFSNGIFVRTSDEHSIIDCSTGKRINDAQDVRVGNHVWVSEGATLNKGADIPDGCIIGGKSFVSKKLITPNSIYVGVPAKLKRENIEWKRELI